MSGTGDITDNTLFSNFKLMAAIEHFPATFTVGSTQNGILIDRVVKKNAHMIETKLLTDHLCDLRQNFLQVLCGTNDPGNTNNSFKLTRTPIGKLLLSFNIARTLADALFQGRCHIFKFTITYLKTGFAFAHLIEREFYS